MPARPHAACLVFLLIATPVASASAAEPATRTAGEISVDWAPWWWSVADLERSFAADPEVIHRAHLRGKSAIHVAAERGDPEIVAWLLDHGVDVNARTERGDTPLIEAADGAWNARRARRGRRWNKWQDNPSNQPRRYRETVEVLLKRGADAEAISRGSITALHRAAGTGDMELVRLLLAAGADARRATDEGRTALHNAAAAGSVEAARLLLDAGADPNAIAAPERSMTQTTPLEEAAGSGRADVVLLLIERGADVRLPADTDGGLLRNAVRHPRVLRVLIDAGIDVATPVNHLTIGAMALQWAVQSPEPCSVKLLIDAGVDDREFLTIGYIAAVRDDPDPDLIDRLKRLLTVKVLLDAGAQLQGPDGRGLPLYLAAHNGHVEIILLLKSRGARLKLRPSTQPAKLGDNTWIALLNQPWRAWLLHAIGYELDLYAAAAYGFEDRLRKILREHPDKVDGEISSLTPLTFAARGGHLNIVKLLIDRGAKVNPKVERGGWFGSAPLKAAAARGKVKVMRVLIAHGADVNVADEDGRTLLERLEAHRDKVRPEVIQLLRKHGARAGARGW